MQNVITTIKNRPVLKKYETWTVALAKKMLYHHAIYELRTPHGNQGNCDVKVQIAENERTATNQISSEKVLKLLFDDGFYQSDGCSQ